MRDERLFLAFRKHPGNRFTLPVLIGCLEEKGLSQNFRVVIAQSREEMVRKVGGKDSLIGFSFMTPDFGQVREEIEWLRAHLSGSPVFPRGGFSCERETRKEPCGWASILFLSENPKKPFPNSSVSSWGDPPLLPT